MQPDLLEFWLERKPLWQKDAACADLPWTLFFTQDENGSRRGEGKLPGKVVCERCPVRTECLEASLANNERHGIWAGLTTRERQKLRRGHG